MRNAIFLTIILFSMVSISSAQVESLPAPVTHGNSFEILSNSRYSVHSGFSGTLSRQVLSNVLWAMNRVPLLGSYRELYVATSANVYLYDSVAHALAVHRTGDLRYNTGAAYEVGIACERDEEAGYSVEAGLLAATAFWDSSVANIATCPQAFAANNANSTWNPTHPIKMVDVFGQYATTGLKRTVQAVSSDSSLPQPVVIGTDTFETVLAALRQDSIFGPTSLTVPEISQLLWAGYGVVPHTAVGNRGTTIPSAVARYYLTRKIYLVRDTGVHRYNNRTPPGTNLTTSDHRLELVTAGDRRPQLRSACPRIPSTAPAYIVVSTADTAQAWATQEAGFAGFQYLMEASILGLQGYLTAPIAPAERSAIISALVIPSSDLPMLVFACGEPAGTRIGQEPVPAASQVGLRVSGNQPVIRIEYSLGTSIAGRLVIYDLAGRTLREFALAPQTAGENSFDWDGKLESGKLVPAGIYVARLEAGRDAASSRFVISR